MTDLTAPQDRNRFKLFSAVPSDLRGRIDAALVDRSPPTIRGVFDQFDLAKRGVSFSAFARYARRVRELEHLADGVGLGHEEDIAVDYPHVLARLIHRRLLDFLAHNEELSLKDLGQVSAIQSRMLHGDLQRRRHEEEEFRRETARTEQETIRLLAAHNHPQLPHTPPATPPASFQPGASSPAPHRAARDHDPDAGAASPPLPARGHPDAAPARAPSTATGAPPRAAPAPGRSFFQDPLAELRDRHPARASNVRPGDPTAP